jgi:hypothetical protein
VRLRKGRLVRTAGPGIGKSPDRVGQVLGDLAHTWRRGCEPVSEETLDALHRRGEKRTGCALHNLNDVYRLRIPAGQDIWALSAQIEALPNVILARPVPVPTPTPLPPDYGPQQGYLRPTNAAATGIDAQYAWKQPGGNGAGVTVCDLEYAWKHSHADVTNALNSLINTNSVIPPGFTSIEREHGIAVVGVMVSDPNGWGTTGICYGADLKTCGTYTPTGFWNVPAAIVAATAQLSAGDVMVLEQQWNYGGSFIPIEWWVNYSGQTQTVNAVYAAIQTAIANGIHVVEVAGNGSYNMDNLTWYGDSGAVVVGAGGAYTGGKYTEGDLQRISFSSYGTRVDLQGWGEDVYAPGYGTHYNADGSNYFFTSSFDGTSSSAPVVAGAIACLSGYWTATFGTNCPPWLARHILRTTGTPQVTPPAGNIGPRPNLRKAFAADSDSDGIPDGWEVVYGMDPTNALDTHIDSDGDGSPNRDEYWADTDPFRSNSVLRIAGITVRTNDVRIDWQGGVQATQYLERCTALASNGIQWTVLFTNRPPTLTSTNLTDAGVTNRALFYRVRVVR